VPARRSRLQKSASDAEAQRSAIPIGNGARGREPGPPQTREGLERVKRGREPGLRWPSRGIGEVLSRALERALRGNGPCKTEGIPDRLTACIVHASGSGRSRRLPRGGTRASGMLPVGEATGISEVRSARTATGTTSPSRRSKENVRPTKANRSDVRQAISPPCPRESVGTRQEPTGRGCWYEEREKAEVGPTHRASWRTRSRKANRRHGAGPGVLHTTC